MGFDKNYLTVLLWFMKPFTIICITVYPFILEELSSFLRTHTSYHNYNVSHGLPVQSWWTANSSKDSHTSYHNCNVSHGLPVQSWWIVKSSKDSNECCLLMFKMLISGNIAIGLPSVNWGAYSQMYFYYQGK